MVFQNEIGHLFGPRMSTASAKVCNSYRPFHLCFKEYGFRIPAAFWAIWVPHKYTHWSTPMFDASSPTCLIVYYLPSTTSTRRNPFLFVAITLKLFSSKLFPAFRICPQAPTRHLQITKTVQIRRCLRLMYSGGSTSRDGGTLD